MTNLESLRAAFRAAYGTSPRLFSAPGRVNLIGEHTDYNDGFVLPMAIDRRTSVAAAPRSTARSSCNRKPSARTTSSTSITPAPNGAAAGSTTSRGPRSALETRTVKLAGADLLVDSDVPSGAGLSSSAALEMSVALALSSLAGQRTHSRVEMALAGQAAEHAYVGNDVRHHGSVHRGARRDRPRAAHRLPHARAERRVPLALAGPSS